MNRVILIGRITKDVEVRYNQDKAIARFTLAVDRQKDETDFIGCVAFGKIAENISKYVGKGKKIAVEGRIQTGNYQKQDGTKVYTTDVVVERADFIEFAERTQAPQYQAPPVAPSTAPPQYQQATTEGFMKVPEGLDDEGLPFN